MTAPVIQPSAYITNGDMTAATVNGPILDTTRMENLRFTGEWPATGAPNGVLNVYGTDDPRAENDMKRNTSTAKWHKLTIPAGGWHGAGFTVAGTDITMTGAAGDIALSFASPFGYHYLGYTKGANAGSATGLQMRKGARGAR